MRSIGVFGEPVCKCMCVGVCVYTSVCVFVYVFVRGTVQVGPNCERGLEHPEHRYSAPSGPLDWRNEVYRQTQKQNLSWKEEKAQQAL